MRKVIISLPIVFLTFTTVDSQVCGNSPEFANFRRPKPLIFPSSKREDPELGRIINGEMARRGAWPWQVSIQLTNPRIGSIGHWCGAVLLDQDWILTAAHCVQNKLVNALGGGIWTVVLGDWDRDNLDGEEVDMVVDRVEVHPNFTDYQNDIALLKLPRSLPGLTPICLPQPHEQEEDDFVGLRCIATGWGQTVHDGPLEGRLHQVPLRIVRNSDCSVMYGLKYGIPITDGHICAGPELGRVTGTCVGDSGGPLQCNLKDGRWYLAGITSFGSGCAKPGFPDVFVRITKYVTWISSIMGREKEGGGVRRK